MTTGSTKTAARRCGMNKPFALMALVALLARASVAADATPSLRLGADLARASDWTGAAVEFRRSALLAESDPVRAQSLWLAGWSYAQTQDWARAEAMVESVKAWPAALDEARMLLRGEILSAQGRTDEADFEFSGVAFRSADSDAKRFANGRLAQHALDQGRVGEARRYAAELGPDHPGPAALEDFLAGSDKSPTLGGWLGAVPGCGYFYSGEIANGVRSLLLNGLFIWGMVETAEDKEWAVFSAITFFEITWYTGSIYGGIDAAHRHNHDRLHRAIDALDGRAVMQPDPALLPEIGIRFRF